MRRKRKFQNLAETTPAGAEVVKNTKDAILSRMKKSVHKDGHPPVGPIEVYLKQVGSPVKWAKRSYINL